MTAIDWAAEAVELLRANAARNGLRLDAVHADWRAFGGRFDLALGADVLYEERNVEPLLGLLPRARAGGAARRARPAARRRVPRAGAGARGACERGRDDRVYRLTYE